MRNALIIFVATLLAISLAFAGYEFLYARAERQRQLEQWQADRAKSERAIEKIADAQAQVESTVRRIDERARVADENARLERLGAAMREDFAAVSAQMRTELAERYMTTLVMPTDNASAGFAAPSHYAGRALKSVTLNLGGRIDFAFNASSGVDEGHLWLIVDISRVDSGGLRWRCETSDYPAIARMVPGCDYVKPATDAKIAAPHTPDATPAVEEHGS